MKRKIAAIVGASVLMCSAAPVFAAPSPPTPTPTPAEKKTDAAKSPATGETSALPAVAAICAAGLVVCGLKVKFD